MKYRSAYSRQEQVCFAIEIPYYNKISLVIYVDDMDEMKLYMYYYTLLLFDRLFLFYIIGNRNCVRKWSNISSNR